MALTTKELLDRIRDKYQLRFLAGAENLDHVCTWVHMVEDTSVAEFFWGNELVVTCGYTSQDTPRLLKFLDDLSRHACAGVIVNVGKYIMEVPPEAVQFCKENRLPLLTMPWEVSMTEFVRESCSLLQKGTRDDDELAQAVMHVVQAPQESDGAQAALREVLDEAAGLRMLALHIQTPGRVGPEASTRENPAVLEQRIRLRLHTALHPLHQNYLVFRHRRRYVVLLNSSDAALAQQAVRRIRETLWPLPSGVSAEIGVGESGASLADLPDCYHSAAAAQRRASMQQQTLVRFEEMGIYRLFYSVPNDELLLRYYNDTLAPLLKADKRGDGVYIETLFRYLLADGSLQQVAAAMYTHRNTVGQRMAKIRQLLDNPLSTTAQRMPYLMAYYAGVVLRLVPEWEDTAEDEEL